MQLPAILVAQNGLSKFNRRQNQHFLRNARAPSSNILAMETKIAVTA